MTPSVLLAEDGKSIHRSGPHVFADLHIVEIAPRRNTELRCSSGVVCSSFWRGLFCSWLRSRQAETPDAALTALLTEARAACRQCPAPATNPVWIGSSGSICTGKIRIGVREYYPLFGTREGRERLGYDVDVGRAMAERLGLTPEFTRVNAASRIPLLADDKIDLTIATMGHNAPA